MNYVYVLISMVGLGAANYLFKFSMPMGVMQTTFFYYLFAAIMSGLVLLKTNNSKPIELNALIWPFLIAFCLFISIITYAQSLNGLEISKASTIRSLSFLVSILLAVVISKEQLQLKDIVAVLLAIGAIGLFSLPNSS